MIRGIELAPLEATHIDAAAELVVAAAIRSQAPYLRADLAQATRSTLAETGPDGGLAALKDGRLVGFLLGLEGARRNVYVPEWGNAAADGSRDVIGLLYRSAAEAWAERGRVVHAVTVFAGDREAADAWWSLGLGMHLLDAAQSARRSVGGSAAVAVRQAALEDREAVCRFDLATTDHLNATPVFLGREAEDPDQVVERLSEDNRPVFLAEIDGEAVGHLTVRPSVDEAPMSIRCPETLSIDGAFVLPAHRTAGVGAALVDHALDWAADHGYSTVAVDYESANIEASAFWPAGGFSPVLRSVLRRIS